MPVVTPTVTQVDSPAVRVAAVTEVDATAEIQAATHPHDDFDDCSGGDLRCLPEHRSVGFCRGD